MRDDSSKAGDKASDIAKNIWLAGLGAYGKAFNEAQQRLDKAIGEPPRLFRDLVEKGAKLEDEVRDSLSNLHKTRAGAVEERIRKVRENFNLSLSAMSPGNRDDMAAVHAKLDALTAKLDALTAAVAGPPGKRPSVKRPSAKRSSVKHPQVKRKAAAAGRKTGPGRKTGSRQRKG